MPVDIRRTGEPVATSDTRRAGRLGAAARALARSPGVAGACCSTSVANSLHFGQRPYQRFAVAPQDWQRKTELFFATRQSAAAEVTG
jgi:hypothetical protein